MVFVSRKVPQTSSFLLTLGLRCFCLREENRKEGNVAEFCDKQDLYSLFRRITEIAFEENSYPSIYIDPLLSKY